MLDIAELEVKSVKADGWRKTRAPSPPWSSGAVNMASTETASGRQIGSTVIGATENNQCKE
jgi:hypothetical protein